MIGLAYVIYNAYLCSRKSMYCAGPEAINALKDSNLAFTDEVASVSFQV